jgi:hypothetical protein
MDETAEPFVHVLLFACRQCNGPASSAVTANESNVDEIDVRAIAVKCDHCGWFGKLVGTEAKRHWVEAWEPRTEK